MAEVTTYQEGGRGKKQCPACKLYVGNKTARCKCGHEFTAKAATAAKSSAGVTDKVEAAPDVSRERSDFGTVRLCTPRGACPATLRGTDRASVEEWMEKIRAKTPDRVFYMKEAYRYWVRDSFDIGSPEFEAVQQVLDEV